MEIGVVNPQIELGGAERSLRTEYDPFQHAFVMFTYLALTVHALWRVRGSSRAKVPVSPLILSLLGAQGRSGETHVRGEGVRRSWLDSPGGSGALDASGVPGEHRSPELVGLLVLGYVPGSFEGDQLGLPDPGKDRAGPSRSAEDVVCTYRAR
jgi:hypothetical protein